MKERIVKTKHDRPTVHVVCTTNSFLF